MCSAPGTGRSDPRPGGEAGARILHALCSPSLGLSGGAFPRGAGAFAAEPGQNPESQEPAGPPAPRLRPRLPDGLKAVPGARRLFCSGGSGPSHSPHVGCGPLRRGGGLPSLPSRHQCRPHSDRRCHGPGLAEMVAWAVALTDGPKRQVTRVTHRAVVRAGWTGARDRSGHRRNAPSDRPVGPDLADTGSLARQRPRFRNVPARVGTSRTGPRGHPAVRTPRLAALTRLLPRAGQPWPPARSAATGARRRVPPSFSPHLWGGDVDATPQTEI